MGTIEIIKKREAIKNGQCFTYEDDILGSYFCLENSKTGYFISIKKLWSESYHYSCVEKITDIGIHFYTYIFNVRCEGFIPFSKLTLIESKTE